ncbi:hypothetical protein ACHAXS_011031 [Conticribra weissflogii]
MYGFIDGALLLGELETLFSSVSFLASDMGFLRLVIVILSRLLISKSDNDLLPTSLRTKPAHSFLPYCVHPPI